MEHLLFSNNDKMPALGLGTYKAAPGEVYLAVLEALKVGYRHFDCAFIYGNEPEIGKALSFAFKNNLVKRTDVWITSKLWCNAMLPDDVLPALNKTLNDLQLEYLDLYLIHWPVPLKKDVSIPKTGADFLEPDEIAIADTWKQMETLKLSGKIKHIGVSNFSVPKLHELISKTNIIPEINQIELHPFLAQNDMLDYCLLNKIHVTAYSPLGTGDQIKTDKAAKKPSLIQNPLIRLIAKDHQCTSAQILIAWSLQRGTSVIPKTVNDNRIKENFMAQDIVLRTEEIEQIAELDFSYRYTTGELWTIPGSPFTQRSLWDE